MKSTFRLLVLVLLVGGWALAALGLHVIVAPPNGNGSQLPARVVVLPKDRLGFGDTYVDTRQWTLNDVSNHPAVVNRLLATGKADVLAHVVKQDKQETKGMSLESILADAVAKGPQDNSPTTAPAQQTQQIETQKTVARHESLAQHASASTSTTHSTRHPSRGS